MKYYLDITLLPDAEANLGFLWQKVYQQVHLALVENKIAENESAIAVSFPQYGDKEFPLGNKLRLFAETQDQFKQLDMGKWLNRLTDYTHITSLKKVPLTVNKYACFKRKQFKSNLIKEAKRRAKYKNESLEMALAHFKHYQTETKLPFISMKSLTKDEQFKLFIERDIFDKSKNGGFGCYGLSKGGLVPWF